MIRHYLSSNNKTCYNNFSPYFSRTKRGLSFAACRRWPPFSRRDSWPCLPHPAIVTSSTPTPVGHSLQPHRDPRGSGAGNEIAPSSNSGLGRGIHFGEQSGDGITSPPPLPSWLKVWLKVAGTESKLNLTYMLLVIKDGSAWFRSLHL